MNTFQAIKQTIREEFDSQKLPVFLGDLAETFSKVHIYYRTFKKTQVPPADLSKGNPAVYAAALQVLSDYTATVSYAVNAALATKCTQDLLHEYRQLSKDYQTLYQAFKWQYPIYQPIQWKRSLKNSQDFFSPSFDFLWQVQIMALARQILKITRCALQVFWQLFKISMCLCDAYLLFDGDTHMRHEACTELIAKWDHYQHELKENKNYLIEELHQGGELADRILKHLGTKKRSLLLDQLKQKVEKLTMGTEKIVGDLSDAAEETLDSVYVRGKMTPLHISLAAGKHMPPALPQGRFPPWMGQEIRLVSTPPTSSTFKKIEDFILDSVEFPFEEAWKDVNWLAGRLHRFYQGDQKQDADLVLPFV